MMATAALVCDGCGGSSPRLRYATKGPRKGMWLCRGLFRLSGGCEHWLIPRATGGEHHDDRHADLRSHLLRVRRASVATAA